MIEYDWTSNSIKWSIASASGTYGDKVNLYFAMHSHEKLTGDNINQSNFPLSDIKAEYGSNYFTCSIAYMIAYAMYKDVKEKIGRAHV